VGYYAWVDFFMALRGVVPLLTPSIIRVYHTKSGPKVWIELNRSRVISNIKRELQSMDLPLMERKWDVVDCDYWEAYVDPTENAWRLRQRVLSLLEEHKTVGEIAEIMNISKDRVYRFRNGSRGNAGYLQ
jgi:hypothetical protein